MVERGVLPGRWLVAAFALLAATTVVCIVFCMAAIAGGGSLQKRLICVTLKAAGGRVFADQVEAGDCVVKCHVCPSDWRMAIGAFGAHGVAMYVVRLVA